MIPGSVRFLGEGNGNPLQYSCLENPIDRGAWLAIIHGLAELDTTEQVALYFTYALLESVELTPNLVYIYGTG